MEQASPEQAFTELEALNELRHADCLSTLQLVATRLAHDIGTPLAVIAGRSALVAQGDLSGDDAKRSAAIIGEQAARISALLRQLLDLTRGAKAAARSRDVAGVMEEACSMLQPVAARRGLTLRAHGQNKMLVPRADARAVSQMITHLLAHAIGLAKPGTEIEISMESLDLKQTLDPRVPGGIHAWVRVMHEPERDGGDYSLRSFDLYAAAQDDSYLGLAICDAVARAQGGRVSAERLADGRACCTFHVPASS